MVNVRDIITSKVTAAKTAPSPYGKKPQQQARRMSTSSNNGKGGGKQFFKKKMPKKHPLKQKAYEVTFKQPKTVPSGVTPGGENGNVSNPVLSGKVPESEGTYNRFSCFAVNSKMAHSTNTKSKPSEGLYRDTDPDNRSEIITDVTIRVPGKPGTMMMEVKVDPGMQPSCIPLHKFKTLFPHLCRDGLPRQGLLDNTQSEFQSYNGADMTCYGYLLIDVKDKVTKKYHPIRFYVMNTDVPRILISHAATEMTVPTDKQQLQSFLGMVNYMGTFIPNLSHHTEPLRAMLKKDNMFHWEEQQTRSFQKIKALIAKANETPLRYYDRTLPVTVQADASLRGLGACLIQKHQAHQPLHHQGICTLMVSLSVTYKQLKTCFLRVLMLGPFRKS